MAKTASKLLGAGILLISSCALCSAATIMLPCTSVGPLPTELNATLACPQFNVLGTLTSMSLELDGSIMGSITLINSDSSTSQTGTGTTSSQFSVGPLLGFTIANPLFTASYTTGTQTLGPSETKAFSGLTGSGSATITNTTNFVPYTGLGSFNISPITTLSSLVISGGGGNFGGIQSTQASATALVTYNYTATTVPEPTTTMMTGGVLLLFGLSLRQLSRRGLIKLDR